MLNYLCIKMPKYVIDLSNDVIGATKRESGAELSQDLSGRRLNLLLELIAIRA